MSHAFDDNLLAKVCNHIQPFAFHINFKIIIMHTYDILILRAAINYMLKFEKIA